VYCYGDLYLLNDLQVRGNKQRLLPVVARVLTMQKNAHLQHYTWSNSP